MTAAPRPCRSCGREFVPRREHFHSCFECWRAAQAANDSIVDELADRIPLLLQLVHPDKHDGSAASTRATQWLLSLRMRLPRAA